MRSLVLLLLLAAVAGCAPRPLGTITTDAGGSVVPVARPGERLLENQAVFVRSVRIVPPRTHRAD
ncbi:MAG TPA: hypothetical protein VF710_13740 [Longimicrobium sp.]|jgi:hypothetical protein